jgi:hypothetical protein
MAQHAIPAGTSAVRFGAKPATAGVTPVAGPAPGFGRMWEKTYTMTVEGVAPRAAIAPWRESFPWPLPLLRRRGRGVSVLHAGAESVTVSTLATEPLAGWVTVSAERAGPLTDVRVQVLTRARDPLSELALALGGHRRQDRFWVAVLTALAAHLALPDPPVTIRGVCLDSRHRWRYTRNICHRPALRTLAQAVTVPLLLLRLGALTPKSARDRAARWG